MISQMRGTACPALATWKDKLRRPSRPLFFRPGGGSMPATRKRPAAAKVKAKPQVKPPARGRPPLAKPRARPAGQPSVAAPEPKAEARRAALCARLESVRGRSGGTADLASGRDVAERRFNFVVNKNLL